MGSRTKSGFDKFVRTDFIRRFIWTPLARVARLADSSALKFHSEIYSEFHSYTRVPRDQYCNNLLLLERFHSVQGCVVECGVWRGGMIAGMARIMGPERRYFLFDSFEGLPKAAEVDGEDALRWQLANTVDDCRTEESYARRAMEISGAHEFEVVKGWFRDTLPVYDFGDRIAVLRLDADWYSSTAECLNFLYEKVTPGGLIIVDDYYVWDGCSKAIHGFLSVNKLSDRIGQFADTVCFLVKKQDEPIVRIEPYGISK